MFVNKSHQSFLACSEIKIFFPVGFKIPHSLLFQTISHYDLVPNPIFHEIWGLLSSLSLCLLFSNKPAASIHEKSLVDLQLSNTSKDNGMKFKKLRPEHSNTNQKLCKKFAKDLSESVMWGHSQLVMGPGQKLGRPSLVWVWHWKISP